MDRLDDTLSRHPDGARWNARYRESGLDAFGNGPSDWLVAHRELVAEHRRGRALDLACGNGRNAFFLAECGYSVDAVDISEVAVEWVARRAEERGLSVTARQLNLETDPLPAADYEVVLNLNYLERSLFPRVRECLAPGGVLIFETLMRDHVEVLGSPMNPEFTLGYNELLHAFAGDGFRVLHYREAIILERSYGKKKALASLIAQKLYPPQSN